MIIVDGGTTITSGGSTIISGGSTIISAVSGSLQGSGVGGGGAIPTSTGGMETGTSPNTGSMQLLTTTVFYSMVPPPGITDPAAQISSLEAGLSTQPADVGSYVCGILNCTYSATGSASGSRSGSGSAGPTTVTATAGASEEGRIVKWWVLWLMVVLGVMVAL